MSSKKNNDSRATIIAYFLVLAIAIIFLLLSFQSPSPYESYLSGISIELLGATLLFFVVQRLLLVREEKIGVQFDEVLNRLNARVSHLKGVEENEDFRSLIEGASEVCVSSISLDRLTRNYRDAIVRRIGEGAVIKFLLVDPDGAACQILDKRAGENESKSTIEATLIRLAAISEEASSAKKGRLEVRQIDHIPSCSLVIIDPSQRTEYVRVTIFPVIRPSSIETRAHFVLSGDLDARWVQSYKEQWNEMWRSSEVVDLGKIKEKNLR